MAVLYGDASLGMFRLRMVSDVRLLFKGRADGELNRSTEELLSITMFLGGKKLASGRYIILQTSCLLLLGSYCCLVF